ATGETYPKSDLFNKASPLPNCQRIFLNRAMPDGLPGSDNSGDRRRTSLWPRDQRPADGFHQKFIDASN
ncbi:hypothetical protein OW909_26565, partial [Klebsiella pneumoniae]